MRGGTGRACASPLLRLSRAAPPLRTKPRCRRLAGARQHPGAAPLEGQGEWQAWQVCHPDPRPSPTTPRPPLSASSTPAARQAPPPGPVEDGSGFMFGGIGSTIAQGMVFLVLVVPWHTGLLKAVFCPRTIQHETVLSQRLLLLPLLLQR